MRFAPVLLALTACSQIFGLDEPKRLSDGGIADAFIDPDGSADTQLLDDAMWQMMAFRRGVNGYASVTDTYLDSSAPAAERSGALDLRARIDDFYAMIMFQDLFSSTAIPVGAKIVLARLQLGVDQGCPAELVEIEVAWNETVTFNTFGPAAGVDDTDLGAIVVTAIPTTQGLVDLDVTSSLKAWAIDPSVNYGWMIRATALGECKFRAGEGNDINERPRLEVTYTD